MLGLGPTIRCSSSLPPLAPHCKPGNGWLVGHQDSRCNVWAPFSQCLVQRYFSRWVPDPSESGERGRGLRTHRGTVSASSSVPTEPAHALTPSSSFQQQSGTMRHRTWKICRTSHLPCSVCICVMRILPRYSVISSLLIKQSGRGLRSPGLPRCHGCQKAIASYGTDCWLGSDDGARKPTIVPEYRAAHPRPVVW